MLEKAWNSGYSNYIETHANADIFDDLNVDYQNQNVQHQAGSPKKFSALASHLNLLPGGPAFPTSLQ